MIYHADPVSGHGYAYTFDMEAILDFLQSSDAVVVKGYFGSKAKACCPESCPSMFPEAIVDAPVSKGSFPFLSCGHSKQHSATLFW